MITEEKLWNYLDGSLNEADRKKTAEAIANDKATAELFQDISSLHNSLKTKTLLSPSVSFVDQVMDALQSSQQYSPPAKISFKLLFLFALPTVVVTIVFAVLLVKYHVPASLNIPFKMPVIDFSRYKLLFVVADMLLAVFFIDSLPGKKNANWE